MIQADLGSLIQIWITDPDLDHRKGTQTKTQVDRRIARLNSLFGNGSILKQGYNIEIHLILTLARFSDGKPEQFWQNAERKH